MPSPKITDQPLVSIGMCVFNCERFLKESLESLLSQEYKNYELIISDNASEDRTQEICLEYQSRDPRIQYSRNVTNMGSLFNYNKVRNLARGKYFMGATDHDLWHPTLLTKCVEVLENDPEVILCYPRTQWVDANRNFWFLGHSRFDTRGMSPAARYLHIINNYIGGEAAYGVFRLEIFKRALKRNEPKAIWANDLSLLAALALERPFAHVPEVLFSLRNTHDETMEGNKKSHAYKLDPAKAQEFLAKDMVEHWRENGEECLAAVQNSSLSDLEKEILIAETKNCYSRRYGVNWPAPPSVSKEKENGGQVDSQASPTGMSAQDAWEERRAARLAQKAAERRIFEEAEKGQISVGVWPLVSVIVPTYNRPDMLVATLQSILDQTYKNHEIIVVNDCGVDVASIVGWLNQQGNITYVKHDRNRGLAAARNTGLKLAQGKYITYLDDDDLFYPHHLETLVTFLETSEYQVAYTDALRAHQAKDKGRYVTTGRDLPYSHDFNADHLVVANQFPVLCLMHEKSCLEKTGLFDESLTTHEDWDLWIRLSLHYKFFHIKRITCEFTWRNDGSTMTSQKTGDFIRTMEIIYAKYQEHLKDKPQIKEHQRQFLQHQKQSNCAPPPKAESAVSAPEELLQQATAALERQDLPAAEGYLRDLIKCYPDMLESYLSLSDVLTLHGQHREAGEILRAARQVDPESLPLLIRLGLNCRQRGDLSGAMAALNKAWTRTPRDPEILGPLAATYFDLGLFQEAKGYFEEASKRNPLNIELWLGLAKAACQLEERNTLERACRRASALNPTHPRLLELTPSLTRETREIAPPPAEVDEALQSLPVGGLSSIIIPVFNNLSLTSQCLKSIWENTDEPYEIIVVDNGSSDGTGDYLGRLEAVGAVRVISNHTNLGFARASNQGAQAARGEHLVFLNNDTIVQPGWLEELAACARKDDKIGAVGARLLYPDDTIQHAGVAFSEKKLVYHIYQYYDRDHPAVNKEREFQAVTAACMLIKKDLFLAIGAFDEGYRNGFEDVDLCFTLRDQGYRIVYNPRAVVYHLESKTQGRHDHESENARRFKSKWFEDIIPDDQNFYREDDIVIEILDRQDNVATILAHDSNDNLFWQEAVKYRREGDLAQAEVCYLRALRFNPFDSRKIDIFRELANFYEAQGKHNQVKKLHQMFPLPAPPRAGLREGQREVLGSTGAF